jgi:hypothetical protein
VGLCESQVRPQTNRRILRDRVRERSAAVTLGAVRHGAVLVALLTAFAVSGCSDDPPDPIRPAPPAPAPSPSYDPDLEPAAAVLALVPQNVTTLTVTDFEQVRLQLGAPDLGENSGTAERSAFWQRADTERPLLSKGMLRPAERRLEGRFGFSQADVAWEAHFYDAQDTETGWVVAFRDGTDMSAVERAVRADAAPLQGAEVDPALRLAMRGTTGEPAQSWAADTETAEMVALPANATYLHQGCLNETTVTTDADLDELDAFAVQFEGTLATARLGAGRHDLFTRMRLSTAAPEFSAGYDGGVADPSTGRIGFQMADPPTAAALALEHQLPFAVCA